MTVKLGVVRLILLQDVVDGSQQHPGDGDNGFLVAAPLFDSLITISDFRVFVAFDGGQSALNQNRLDISPSTADAGSFLLPGTLVVLRSKSGP